MNRRHWEPPSKRPGNESAGYLGYYTRVHCDELFDLVDGDGVTPIVWYYRKAETLLRRIYEEKPSWQRQKLKPSENRTLRDLIGWANGGVYVIWKADRLIEPKFPIKLTRLGRDESGDHDFTFDRERFDHWLREGLAQPPVAGVKLLDAEASAYVTVENWLRAPWVRRDDEAEIDALVRDLAAIIRRPVSVEAA